MIQRWILYIQDSFNGLFEPRKVFVRHENLSIMREQPYPVRGDIRNLNCRSKSYQCARESSSDQSARVCCQMVKQSSLIMIFDLRRQGLSISAIARKTAFAARRFACTLTGTCARLTEWRSWLVFRHGGLAPLPSASSPFKGHPSLTRV